MSFLFEIIRLGLKNLRLHMLRSVLTSLGIILGVGAVIIMVSIGEGNKQAALREIEQLGATNVIVRSTQPPESASIGSQERSFVASFGLERADLRRIEHFLSDVAGIVPLKEVGDEISYGPNRSVSQTYGTTPDLAKFANLEVARGRYLTNEDLVARSSVAVIGHNVAQKFFRLIDPIGEEIRVGDRVFRVVGVLRPIGLAGGAGAALVGRDLNEDVHVPMTTAELVFGDVVFRRSSGSFSGEEIEVSEIYVTAKSTDDVIQVSDRIERILEQGHPGLQDVKIIVPWELLENAKRTTMVMNIMLVAIAAISLLVGGIGIMNIMLASVTERTREIGIRRALGANRRHIVLQFLVETGSLSMVGGVVGILIGVGFSLGVEPALPWLLDQFPADYFDTRPSIETQVTSWSIMVSFFVATGVGLVFGIYPAIVASKQDPIVALRHD